MAAYFIWILRGSKRCIFLSDSKADVAALSKTFPKINIYFLELKTHEKANFSISPGSSNDGDVPAAVFAGEWREVRLRMDCKRNRCGTPFRCKSEGTNIHRQILACPQHYRRRPVLLFEECWRWSFPPTMRRLSQIRRLFMLIPDFANMSAERNARESTQETRFCVMKFPLQLTGIHI